MLILDNSSTINVIRTLSVAHGAKVYLVGEAPRDLLLGVTPSSYHFVLDNDPVQFAYDVAARESGHVRVHEMKTGGCRVGHYVSQLGDMYFSSLSGHSIGEHLERHSYFTIDSIAFDLLSNRVIENHNAVADMHGRLVRAISPIDSSTPRPRIVLRAISLATSHAGLDIDRQTSKEIRENSSLLANVAPPDIGFELSRILSSQEHLKGIDWLDKLELLPELMRNFLPHIAFPDEARDMGKMFSYPVEACMTMLKRVDELIPPENMFLKRNVCLLRQVVFLSQQIRRHLSDYAPEEIKPLLKLKGEYIEAEFGRLITSRTHVFRIRIVTIAYLKGIADLINRPSGLNQLLRVVERIINDFGLYKGILSTILICADWTVLRSAQGAAQKGMSEAEEAMCKWAGEVMRRYPDSSRRSVSDVSALSMPPGSGSKNLVW